MKSIPFYLSIIMCLLLLVYGAEMNSLSIQGYVIQNDQEQLDDIKQRYVSLQTEVAQYSSISHVRNNEEVKDMEASTITVINIQKDLVKR